MPDPTATDVQCRDGAMSHTLELLRVDPEHDLWLNRSSSGCGESIHRHCPVQLTPDAATTGNKAVLDHIHRQRTRHSYYKCCINVHVSQLLDHWLDWDRPGTHPGHTDWPVRPAPRRIEDMLPRDPLEWVRQNCSSGCDVNSKDENGRPLLHYVLLGDIGENVATYLDATRLLIESGADPSCKDASGNTPLLQIQHLLNRGLFSPALSFAKFFLLEHSVDVNVCNDAGRSLLSYSVEHGDRSSELTRFLLNAGASVWTSDDESAFTWFLDSVIKSQSLASCDETLMLLCQVMGDDPQRMRGHVLRTMMASGKNARVIGPIFQQLKARMLPFWTRPRDLRDICRKSVRKALGPKRVCNGGVAKLRLPRKLEKFITMEEMPKTKNANQNPPPEDGLSYQTAMERLLNQHCEAALCTPK